MLHKAWNSKGEMPYRSPRSSVKFQGHTVQNITDFDPNWAFPDCRPVAVFKSLRFALFCMSCIFNLGCNSPAHDDFIKWKHFPCYWPFVQGIQQSPVNSPHKGQWRGALMFSLICAWIKGWVNKWESGDLRCHHAHYDVSVMPMGETRVLLGAK